MTYDGPIWEGVYSSFSEVPVTGPGFDGEVWVQNSLKKMVKIREEAQKNLPLPPVSNYREALLPLLAALHYKQNGSVRILDFGGGIGFAYYQTLYALSKTSGLEYHIVEREEVCRAGREFFLKEEVYPIFHAALEEVSGNFDIVHFGSSLHYVNDWIDMLDLVSTFQPQYQFFVDLPAGNIPTFATMQHFYGSGIPAWFFNIDDFVRLVEQHKYKLNYKSVYEAVILGKEQCLPMSNFSEEYRLPHTCNLLFSRNKIITG